MKTLNINQAAIFLGAHKETIRRLASLGVIPAAKVGRSWLFIEQDLVMYVRNRYSTSDALQGVHNGSNKIWHSIKEKERGGLTSSTKEKEYAKVLGLK